MDKVNIECVFLLFSFLFLMRFRSDFFCFGCSKTVCNRRLSLKFSQNDSFFFSHFFVLFDDLSSVMSFTFCAYFAVYLSLIFFSLASSLHILFMHTNMKTIWQESLQQRNGFFFALHRFTRSVNVCVKQKRNLWQKIVEKKYAMELTKCLAVVAADVVQNSLYPIDLCQTSIIDIKID